MAKPHVRVYIDDDPQPVIDRELPTELTLDTRKLTDGPHRLIVRAEGQSGAEGVEEIPFQVQNGPGILVSGLRPGSTRRGELNLRVDAFSTDDPFDPRRAEARSLDSDVGVGVEPVRGGVGRVLCRAHVGRAGVLREYPHLHA